MKKLKDNLNRLQMDFLNSIDNNIIKGNKKKVLLFIVLVVLGIIIYCTYFFSAIIVCDNVGGQLVDNDLYGLRCVNISNTDLCLEESSNVLRKKKSMVDFFNYTTLENHTFIK